MKEITLIVKAPCSSKALNSCRCRMPGCVLVEEVSPNQWLVRCPIEGLEQVLEWFHDEPYPSRTPYRDGTLLWFAVVDAIGTDGGIGDR